MLSSRLRHRPNLRPTWYERLVIVCLVFKGTLQHDMQATWWRRLSYNHIDNYYYCYGAWWRLIKIQHSQHIWNCAVNFQTNTRPWADVVLMLGQRRRRWPNIKTASAHVCCELEQISCAKPKGSNCLLKKYFLLALMKLFFQPCSTPIGLHGVIHSYSTEGYVNLYSHLISTPSICGKARSRGGGYFTSFKTKLLPGEFCDIVCKWWKLSLTLNCTQGEGAGVYWSRSGFRS